MRWFLFVLYSVQTFAFMVGNPADPSLMQKRILPVKNQKWSFRTSFLSDYVYSQMLRNAFEMECDEEKPPNIKTWTEAAQITLNVINLFDFYGILGHSRIQMDEEIFTESQLAWGAGLKAILYKNGCFRIGCDFKYFQTDQKPLFFVTCGMPLDLISNMVLKYQEYQGALGLSYQNSIVCPYLMATYVHTQIHPNSHTFLVQIPRFETLTEAKTRSFIEKISWGAAVGATLLIGEKGALSVESRFLNQNALNASLEWRF